MSGDKLYESASENKYKKDNNLTKKAKKVLKTMKKN